MKKIKYNEFILLAILATSVMGGIIYSVEWPNSRQMASTSEAISAPEQESIK